MSSGIADAISDAGKLPLANVSFVSLAVIGERLLSEAMMRNIANRKIYNFTKVLFEIG